MRHQRSGIMTLFAKSVGCSSIFLLRINSNGYMEIVTELDNIYTNNIAIMVNVWTHIAATIMVNSYSGDSTIALYQNGFHTSSHQTSILADVYRTASYHIGMRENADFYQGFIWSVSLRNNPLSAEEIAGKMKSAGCPSGLSFCLSSAEFLQTAEGEACLPACVYGCVRTTDCSLCIDRMCSACETFETSLRSCRANGESCSCLHGGINF